MSISTQPSLSVISDETPPPKNPCSYETPTLQPLITLTLSSTILVAIDSIDALRDPKDLQSGHGCGRFE
jgi:hypothetical protein